MQSLCSTYTNNDIPPNAFTFILLCDDDHLLRSIRPASGIHLRILSL